MFTSMNNSEEGKSGSEKLSDKPELKPRVGGFLKGQGWESPDCWEPDEELIKLMTEGPIFPE